MLMLPHAFDVYAIDARFDIDIDAYSASYFADDAAVVASPAPASIRKIFLDTMLITFHISCRYSPLR